MVETEALNREFRAVCERLDRILEIIDSNVDIPTDGETPGPSEDTKNFGSKIGDMLNKTEKED